MNTPKDPFNSLQKFDLGNGQQGWLYSLPALERAGLGRISRLPDSAFAVVESSPGGQKLRHLPHHDETGAVDPAHLRAALARLSQVKWLDRANEAVARRHLEGHALEAARSIEHPRR